MRDDLIDWQWQLYPANHTSRANLVIHVITVPLFMFGTLSLVFGVFFLALGGVEVWWLPLAGLGAMALAMAAQGRGHRGEAVAPVPFSGPGDMVSRIFVEQWVTWPRFVLSGRLAAAWVDGKS